MKFKILYFIIAISIFLFLGLVLFKNNHKEKENLPGALEGLRLMAYQRAYPNLTVSDSKYFEAFEKFNQDVNVSLREDTEPWESLGPHNTAGRTLSLAFNPQNPNTIFAGSASGGLWKSYNMGKGISWEFVSTGFPVLGISSIAFAPQDSLVMYLGTGEVYNYQMAGTGAADRATRGTYGIGILKSNDGGKSWNKSLNWTSKDGTGVNEIKVSQTNENIVYAATTEGTFKSTNAGANWGKIHDVVMATDLVVHPTNPNILIVGCGNLGSENRGIYRSMDGGENWTKAGNPIPNGFQGKILLDMAPSNSNYVYASIGNGFGFNDGATWLCRSVDMGQNWEIVNQTDYSRWQGWFAHDIAVNPSNELDLVMVGIDVWKSSNGGEEITQVSSGGLIFGTPLIGHPEGPEDYSHSDHHAVIYHPTDHNTILYGNDGGVNLSIDNGFTFQTVNGGFQSVQFYNGFSVSQSDPNFALGGLQDNSTVIFDGTKAWTRVIGGDGSWTAVNAENDSIIFGSSQGLNIRRSENRGTSFSFAVNVPNQNEWTSFIAPYVLAPSKPTTMYAGRARVYKSLDSGLSFQATNNNQVLNGDPIFCMAVSPLNPDVVLAATAPTNFLRKVFITNNGGEKWKAITFGLPNAFPTDVCFSPDDEGTAYITFGGFETGHVYKTSNFGSNWNNITGNLPDVPTSAIAIDPDSPHHLYIGNDLGVFVSIDGGDSWEPYNDGFFGTTLVMDLKIMNNDRKLYVATHGNGAFRRDLLEQTSPVKIESTIITAVKIFPNPVRDQLNLELNTIENFNSIIEIYTLTGVRLRSVNESFISGLNIKNIDLSSYPTGNYLLKILGDNIDYTIKFIKI